MNHKSKITILLNFFADMGKMAENSSFALFVHNSINTTSRVEIQLITVIKLILSMC